MGTVQSSGSWWLVIAGAIAGLGLGVWLVRQLADGGYRLDDEGDHPPPRWSWLLAAGVSAVWATLAWRLGGPVTLPSLPAVLLLGFAGVALAWIDLDVHRLPHGLTYPLAAHVLGLHIVASAVSGQWWPVARALACAGAAYLVLLALAVVSRGAFGLGDVTLGGILGLSLGYLDVRLVWVAVLLAFVISGLVSAVGLLTRRLTLRSDLAFGPYLLVGGWLAVLVG